jgi:hypothetical protein
MTKPVAVFRSKVIGDPRHTVRLDENSHLVLFPSFSRYITSWAISATWPVEASRSRCYRPGSGIWLVVGWLPCWWGLEAGSGWSLRPPTAIYRLYLETHFTYNWGSGFLSVGQGRWSESEIFSPLHDALGGACSTAPNGYV